MTRLEELRRQARQSKDRVRRFASAWRARPFIAQTRSGDPIVVSRANPKSDRWSVTYYVNGQPAGRYAEKSFVAAVTAALREHHADLETAEPFVDPAAVAETAIAYAKDFVDRAEAEDGALDRYASPLWRDAIDAYDVAADALEDVGQTYRADAVRRQADEIARQVSRQRAPRRWGERDARRSMVLCREMILGSQPRRSFRR